jgi:uncharacterized protein (DUF1800 family)
MNGKHIQHLYWRSGFGISPSELGILSKKSKENIVNGLFQDSKNITPLIIDTSEVEAVDMKMVMDDKSVRMDLVKKSAALIKKYNVAWVNRLMHPTELLRERMTLFWSNLFVVKDNNIMFVQEYNNVLREHALGDFGAFVKAIAKQPAMIKYLNNKQNRKQHPNENFARELMELFTLGKGNYTEEDIKESARAFTGFSHDFDGDFVLRQRQHDEDQKTFFGKTGNFDGDDIVDIILEQKQCAQFICEKIYSYFVNENMNSKHVSSMVDVFYKKYDIEVLMRFVFSSKWFYDDPNIGTKIKSPMDYLVGMNQVVPMTFKKENMLFAVQKMLGQILLNPPNVAGWKGGKQWIDSNTILLRMRYPSLFLNNARISTSENATQEEAVKHWQKKSGKNFNYFKVEANWEAFNTAFKTVDISDLDSHIIMSKTDADTKTYLESLNRSSKREYCIQLMSIPEYQMC